MFNNKIKELAIGAASLYGVFPSTKALEKQLEKVIGSERQPLIEDMYSIRQDSMKAMQAVNQTCSGMKTCHETKKKNNRRG